MTVIINEFEIELEPPAAQEGESPPGAGSETQASPPAMGAKDLDDLISRRLQRLERIRAH